MDVLLQELSLALMLFDRFIVFGGGPLFGAPKLLHALMLKDDMYLLEESQTKMGHLNLLSIVLSFVLSLATLREISSLEL